MCVRGIQRPWVRSLSLPQVQNKQGQWVDAPPMDSTFVCNIGQRRGSLEYAVLSQTACDVHCAGLQALGTVPRGAQEPCGGCSPPLAPGDMFATLTGGLYAATPHRVVNADPSRSRVSVPFFFEPAFEALVAPLPGLSTPAAMGAAPTGRSPPAAAPVRYGAHLESKVLSNFEL